MNILVTGGAGYIGSHAMRELIGAGHEVVVLDNLSHGHREAVDPRAHFVEGSTGNTELVVGLLTSHSIEAVMHFAADIEVGESVADPGKYYRNNFAHALSLLEAMRVAHVNKIVFSSTAAVYGIPLRIPLLESDPRNPINPYGRSKMMTEMAIEDFSRAHGLGYAILRYFNVAGASPDAAIGEDHRPESHLIPRILLAARDRKPIKIFGTDYATPDGTCIRDYVHVMDLVRAHLVAIERIRAGEGSVYNVGIGRGFSVREVISACEEVTGLRIETEEAARRSGDPDRLVACTEKLQRELGWKPVYAELRQMVSHAWSWHCRMPEGYQTPRDRPSEFLGRAI